MPSMPRFYRTPSFWATTLLCIFAIAPLLRPGYFWGAHDARHDVYFILQYNVTWNEGTLFPRWSPDWAFGYGYPFFNIYAPGATFLGTLLYRLLPLSFEGAVKATLIATIVLSAWSMWFFVRDWLGERAALVAAVAYVYVPYHLVDIYVRAAMAEALALALLPLALWGARRATLQPGLRSIALAAIGYAAIHLSSNLVALIFTPVLVGYILALTLGVVWRSKGKRKRLTAGLRTLVAPALGIALGIALAAFFVLPALLEARFVNLDQWFKGYYDFHDHFVYFAQLFEPRWDFGISEPGPNDPLSFQLGLVAFALAALAAWRWLRKETNQRLETGFWLAVLLVAVWLTTAASTWAWDHLPLVASAQFPWRYLTLAALALAILAPTVLDAENKSWLPPLLLAGLLILGSAPYLRVQIAPPPPGGATLAGLMEFQRSANEMTGMTITAEEIPTWSPIADLHIAGAPVESQVDYSRVPQDESLAVHSIEHRVASETIWVHAGTEGKQVSFYRQWYPGWTATFSDPDTLAVSDRFPLTPEYTMPPYGLLNVPVPAGDHILHLSFEDTPIRRAGDLVSLATIISLLLLLGWQTIANRRRASANSKQ